MPVSLVMPKPNPKQEAAFRERHRYVAYGGARGGGKSHFVRWKAILMCLSFPGIKVLITRRTFRELFNNHIAPLLEILGDSVRYVKADKMIYFPNGSTITFGYCDTDKDVGQYQGAEYDVWFADEAGQFQEEWLTKIDKCVRGVNGFPKRSYYTLNPGGPSHGYFKRLFVDRRYKDNEDPQDYAFIQAKVTDNTALMQSQPDYIKGLEALPAKLRLAWLDGRWDVFEGQFFEDFVDSPEHYRDRLFTHVIDPFEIPQNWRIYRSFDWGYKHPFSCGWWAVDDDGIAYRILEYYGCTGEPNEGVKMYPPEVFQEIARIEREHRWLAGKKIIGIADPAIWNGEKGESIAETAAKFRVYFEPGDHARIPGWMQVHYRLGFDVNGIPMMYVFSNCKAFIRTMPTLEYSKNKPEDLDTNGEDHVADEVRYFCMARPMKPPKGQPADPYKHSPLALYLDIPKDKLTPAPVRRAGIEILEV